MIEKEKGENLANEFHIKFLETSAKDNTNIDKVFITLAKDIKQRLIDVKDDPPKCDQMPLNLKDQKLKTKANGGCC